MINFPYNDILEVVSLRDDSYNKVKNKKVLSGLWKTVYKIHYKQIVSSCNNNDIYGYRITSNNLLLFSKFANEARCNYPIIIKINIIEGDSFCDLYFKNLDLSILVSDISDEITLIEYYDGGMVRSDFRILEGDIAFSIYTEIKKYILEYLSLGDDKNDQAFYYKPRL